MITISVTTRQAISLCHALRLSQRVTQDSRDIIDRHDNVSHLALNELINDLVNVRTDVERKLKLASEKRSKEQWI